MPTTYINSHLKALHLVRIEAFPARVMKGMRLYRLPHFHGVVVGVDERGRRYSTQVKKSHTISNLDAGTIAPTIAGLVKLGAISAEAVAEHRAALAKSRARDRSEEAARLLLDTLGELGIKLTNAQLGKVDRALGGRARAAAIIADKLAAKEKS